MELDVAGVGTEFEEVIQTDLPLALSEEIMRQLFGPGGPTSHAVHSPRSERPFEHDLRAISRYLTQSRALRGP